MTLKAKDIMTKLVVTAKVDTPLQDLVRTMLDRRITGVPIVDDDGNLVGIVAQDDILLPRRSGGSGSPPGMPEDTAGLMGGGFVTFSDPTKTSLSIDQVMTRDVVSAEEETSLRDLASLMWEKRVHRVPICDEAGVLTGIVSSMDICRVISEGGID